MNEFNETYTDALNVSWTTTDPEVQVDLGLAGNLMMALTLTCVTVAWLLNIVVLRSISKTDEEKLKVRFLLKNAIAGDMMLALSFALRIIMALAGANETNTSIASLCAVMTYDFYSYFAVFYQIFASMAVAIDRFFSILKPLSYHAMKYDVRKKSFVFLAIFVSTFALSLPVVLVKLKPGDSFSMVCHRAFERASYAEVGLPFVIICSVLFTLAIYCTLFGMIIFHRRKKLENLGQQNENQTARKNQTSLALTFFLIHITYVLMYVPGALYHSALSQSLADQPYLDFYLGQLTITVYLANTIVDPIIYIIRIRSIREHVPCCSRKGGKAQKLAQGKITDKHDQTTTSTVGNFSNIATVDK